MNPYENLYIALEKQAVSNSLVSRALDKTIQRENIAKKNLATVDASINKHSPKINSAGDAVGSIGSGILGILINNRSGKKWKIRSKYNNELKNLDRKKTIFKDRLTKNLGFSTHR